jgi:hypothetical protein
MGRPLMWTSRPQAAETELPEKVALSPLKLALSPSGHYGGGMFKKLLFLALIVGVGFLAAKKLRAA